jgi:hypothetical protein
MQLNVLTGSADNGGKLFKELEQFAIATSFSFDEVTNQARTFLALGIQQSDVVDTLTLIGTLSMGDAERLKQPTEMVCSLLWAPMDTTIADHNELLLSFHQRISKTRSS